MHKKKIKIETMTSRERVVNVLNHRPVDRVPIDLGMNFSTGINGFAYWNLKEYLGFPMDVEIATLKWFLARVDEKILERFHCDCILLNPPWENKKVWEYDNKRAFIIPSALKTFINSDGNWCLTENEDKGMIILDKSTNEVYQKGLNSKYFESVIDIPSIAKRAEQIYKETEYATFFQGPGAFYRNDPNWLCQLVLEPEDAKAELKFKLDGVIEYIGNIINNMGGYMQGYCIGSDLGTQRAPYINPALYEETLAPIIKKLCSFIHRNSDFKVFFHSCGAIKPFIPILIDCGIDILNPIQISAEGMIPEELKAEYGKDLVFWGGGCDTQNVLGSGTPEEVAKNVRKLMSVFKPSYGYVFNQVQDIMANVPPENVVAMFDTAYAESFYEDNKKVNGEI